MIWGVDIDTDASGPDWRDKHFDQVVERQRTRPISNMSGLLRVRMVPEYGAEPGLWLGTGDRGDRLQAPWGEAPISDGLRADLTAWNSTWEQACYFRRNEWPSKDAYMDWEAQGWLLWAEANRELIPQGYVVEEDFEGYPELRLMRRRKASTNHRMWARKGRQPASARRVGQILERANEILRQHGRGEIAAFVIPVALAKPRGRSHWRSR
jgi:hypothetical protein